MLLSPAWQQPFALNIPEVISSCHADFGFKSRLPGQRMHHSLGHRAGAGRGSSIHTGHRRQCTWRRVAQVALSPLYLLNSQSYDSSIASRRAQDIGTLSSRPLNHFTSKVRFRKMPISTTQWARELSCQLITSGVMCRAKNTIAIAD